MKKTISEKYKNAWLGLGDTTHLKPKHNPLSTLDNPLQNNQSLELCRIMSDPKYWGFLCKHILNINLHPIQLATLQTLNDHAFPMLIASRGFSKCITKNTLIMTSNGIGYIGDIISDNYNVKQKLDFQVIGVDGKYQEIDYGWSQKQEPTIKLETRVGYKLEGTTNHPILAIKDGELQDVELKDLSLGDYVAIDRTESWFQNTNNIEEDIGYLLGCLVGDGGYTVRGRISFTTSDKEIVDRLNLTTKRLWNKQFKKDSYSKYGYNIYGVHIWDELFQVYGFNSSVCGEKSFPTSILHAPKNTVAAFIRGLFDTDGMAYKNILGVSFCSKSSELVRILQFVLTRFGIISNHSSYINHIYDTRYHILNIFGNDAKLFYSQIGFALDKKQKKLGSKLNKTTNPNLDIIPKELILSQLLILRQKFSYLLNRVKLEDNTWFSIYRFNQYNCSYKTLKRVLDFTIDLKNESEWQYLNGIYNKNYYFSPIKSLAESKDDVYDVHLKQDHHFISNGLVSHNSFLLAIYAYIKCLTVPRTKIICAGAAFRQSKFIFDYMSTIWDSAPILRDICNNKSGPSRDTDRCTMFLNDSWMMSIPIGTGEMIRGLRANIILCDEFNSVRPDIYETVIQGFTAVSADPIDNAKSYASREALIKDGMWSEHNEDTFSNKKRNQSIISGTAGFDFEHFASYWKTYKSIIESRGNITKLEEILKGNIPAGFNWKDYAIIRFPYELIPPGFMDEKQVAKARATVHSGIYSAEFGAVFSKDSSGFFKRSLIEGCVASDIKPINLPSGKIHFSPLVRGNTDLQYIYGIDPAADRDNFTIVIIEIRPDHNRTVYCWSTNRKSFQDRQKMGLTKEQDFYKFCGRKIRDLMKIFPAKRIGLDGQGGGIAVEETLHDSNYLQPGERPIWQIIEDDNPKITDDKAGEHVLEIIQFARAEWVSQANHGLRKDMEDKTLLFPHFDSISLEQSYEQDKRLIESGNTDRLYDSLEDCVLEIEELKNELCTIVMTKTGTGQNARDRWDTPEIKGQTGKKERIRKDRYTALLIANMIARQIQRAAPPVTYEVFGGASHMIDSKAHEGGKLYNGPDWFNPDASMFTSIKK